MSNVQDYSIFKILIIPAFFSLSAATDGVPYLADLSTFAEKLAAARTSIAATLGGMDAEARVAPTPKPSFAQLIAAKKAGAVQSTETVVVGAPTPKPSFAQLMAAKKAGTAHQAVLADPTGRKTLPEFAADAVDGKVGDHFVIPHTGRVIIRTATHKAIPIGHESFDPTAGTHVVVADAQRQADAETQAKDLADANIRKTQALLATVKADFSGEIAGAMDPILTLLCTRLKADTDVSGTDDATLVRQLAAGDADSDALVTKFLAAHGAFAQDSAEATKIKRLVDLVKFFNE